MKSSIYLLTGLGADERVFHRMDFSEYSITYIKWITPNHKETIESYAARLREQITEPNPILIGLSFGGMMAVEIAKQIETRQVILIASAKTKHEIPFYYRFAGFLKLHNVMPSGLFKKSNFVTNWIFGTTSTYDRQLLKLILKDTDPIFLKWAIEKVVRWRNTQKHPNTFHIHGSSDRILPSTFIKCDIKVKKAGHFMTLNNAEELNRIIREIIRNL